MPVIIKKIDNSFIEIKNYDQNLLIKLRDNFSFFAPNYKYSPKYKSGMWSGKIYLFNSQTGKLPFGLARQAIKIIRDYTKNVVIDFNIFNEGISLTKKDILDFCESIKFPFTPYDHQIEAIIKCLKSKRLTIESATGSGKSGILFLIANLLLLKNKNEKILLIVPSIQLVEQMSKDFIEYAKDWVDYSKYIHKIYGGQEKESNKQITISTYQSLMTMKKDNKLFNCSTLLIDECHIIFNNNDSIKAVNKIINNCVNAENKFGFSGSLLNSHSTELQLNGLFGKVERIVNAKDLIDVGILAKFDITSIILDYDINRRIDLKNQIDAIPKTKKNYDTAKYALNMQYVRDLSERDKFVINFCTKIKKNTIVLFKNIKYGTKIYKELYKHSGKKVYFVDGTVPVLKREEIRENMEKYDNCILVGSSATVSTGINIKRIYNAVFIESMKSEIKVVQSIGRILRQVEGKSAKLYDLVDDLSLKRWTCYGIRHHKDRQNIYKSQGHNVKILKIKI